MEALRKIFGKRNEDVERFRQNAVNYTHIQACGPGGVADADGGFAQKFYEFAE